MKNFYILILFILFFTPFVSFGSTVDGIIDPQYHFAWSAYLGWFNWTADQGNVHVTDSGLTGYIWNQNYGWINLAPTSSGVKNDGEGHLSGFAWGENLGWGDYSGVTIDANGIFHGSVINVKLNSPSLTFDCDQCSVKTDWRPASVRNNTISSVPTGGGGGGILSLPTLIINPITTPITTPIIIPNCNGTIGFSTSTGQSCASNTGGMNSPIVVIYNFGTTILKNGSRGNAVMELQRFLNDKLNLGLVVDGKLGLKTIAVIKKWQLNNGLVADGLVGIKTKTKMNALVY